MCILIFPFEDSNQLKEKFLLKTGSRDLKWGYKDTVTCRPTVGGDTRTQ
jgi:hypothetical protein